MRHHSTTAAGCKPAPYSLCPSGSVLSEGAALNGVIRYYRLMRLKLITLLLVVGCQAEVWATDSGEELYAESCARCHGEQAEGLMDFSLSEEEFIARLEGETDSMPDFTDYFYPEEVAELYAWLSATVGGSE